jgi:hypothetical protein
VVSLRVQWRLEARQHGQVKIQRIKICPHNPACSICLEPNDQLLLGLAELDVDGT